MVYKLEVLAAKDFTVWCIRQMYQKSATGVSDDSRAGFSPRFHDQSQRKVSNNSYQSGASSDCAKYSRKLFQGRTNDRAAA